MAGEGKYALLEVPDFGGGMSSYLRLGAAAPLGTSAGDDLAARIQSFTDDERKRDGCPDFVPVGERKAETARLHTKGGWRDHADGNRISTTRGDKIEVIGGNYRMLILGRGEHESGWDISGGHVTEVSETFAGGTTIEWVEEYGGTWKVVETTVKGEVHSTYHGDVVDCYYGKRKVSVTGTESPGAPLSYEDDSLDDTKKKEVKSIPKENPEIVEKTWAKRISSYTGSAALRVPVIHEEIWADIMKSTTNALSKTDTTTVEGESRSTTTATTITSVTEAGATKDVTTVEGTIESTTRAAKIVSTTHADSRDETYGDTTTYQQGNTDTTVEGIESTVNLGMVNEVVLGMMNEVTVGAEVAVTVGASVNVTVGVSTDISLAASVEIDCVSRIEISPSEVTVKLDETHVALSRKIVSGFNLYF
jgi:hypothetical protein